MWAIVGVHPTDNKRSRTIKNWKELAQDPKVVAIGECGFDFARTGKKI
jgi:Tat protein secretion system quality control protein TatD with DNase activity